MTRFGRIGQPGRDRDADRRQNDGLHERQHHAGHGAQHFRGAELPCRFGIGGFASVVDDFVRDHHHHPSAQHDEHQQVRPDDAEELAEDELAAADRLGEQRECGSAVDFVGHRNAGGPHGDQERQDHDRHQAGIFVHLHVFAERVVRNDDVERAANSADHERRAGRAAGRQLLSTSPAQSFDMPGNSQWISIYRR